MKYSNYKLLLTAFFVAGLCIGCKESSSEPQKPSLQDSVTYQQAVQERKVDSVRRVIFLAISKADSTTLDTRSYDELKKADSTDVTILINNRNMIKKRMRLERYLYINKSGMSEPSILNYKLKIALLNDSVATNKKFHHHLFASPVWDDFLEREMQKLPQ